MKTLLFGLLLPFIFGPAPLITQPAPPVDHLHLQGPIAFNGQTFRLSTSAQPTPTYVRQEYLPTNEPADGYHNLFMLSVITNGQTIDQTVATQVQRLTDIQEEDLTVHYRVRKDSLTGTATLDFVWRANSDDTNPIMEWNAYRFEPYTSPTGQKGVLMAGNRRRAYGSEIVAFLEAFRTERPQILQSLATFKTPVAVLSNQ
ncbi:hypothetical protein [Fibrella aquatilis]|uniref:Uncharacterized protein n=1 Tax=Fibrella aquatilis TaxID=2817059 RepID=A0A939G0Y9_9BACT|nr:hypothetical protein [Fibrella aquatilis]MBO0929851.1 hypothetical protein [Fibrella aquatilis]